MDNDRGARPVRLDLGPLARVADPETGVALLTRGALAGRANHLPVRASAPAAHPIPGECTVGLTVRPDATASSPVAPRVGADTQLTAAAGDPPTPVAAVDQPAGAP